VYGSDPIADVGPEGPSEGEVVVTSIRKAWRRLMLIVLMPDSVMGRSQGSNTLEAAMLGATEVQSERIR